MPHHHRNYTPASLAPTIKERSMTVLSLVLLFGLFSAAGAVMAYYFLKNPDLLFSEKNQASSNRAAVSLKFEDTNFSIPSYLLVNVKRTTLRKVTKINMTVPLDWTPDQTAERFNDSSTAAHWIFSSIEEPASKLSSRDWLRKIYRHYIAAPAASDASGLYRYYFKPGSPYSSIELFTDDLQNPKMIIRCEKQKSALNIRLCNREIPVTPRLVMQYKFPRAHLNRWQGVHRTMQTLLGKIHIRKGN